MTLQLIPLPPPVTALRLAVAALVGLAVGTEREWSGPVAGPSRRFAGVRTFLLFGIAGGISGLLITAGQAAVAAALVAGAGLFVVSAYVMAARRPEQSLDGTTEAAAFVVLGLGVLAGLGSLGLAAGTVAIVVFALGQKEQLHRLVARISAEEMRAITQFLVISLAILPLLPTGPYLGVIELRPRMLWGIVVFLSGLNFAGFLARRTAGSSTGYGIVGALGGIISSTAVTVQFARESRRDPDHGTALATGVAAATTVLPVRVVVIAAALNDTFARALAPRMVPAFAVGLALVAAGMLQRRPGATAPAQLPEQRNPLRFSAALQMALVFQVAIVALRFIQGLWGTAGVMTSAPFLGVADADALTVSMNQVAIGAAGASLAAHAVALGLLASTLFKLGLATTLGVGKFRRRSAWGLSFMAIAFAAAFLWP